MPEDGAVGQVARSADLREALQPIAPRRVDLPIQSERRHPAQAEEPEEPPHLCHHVLQAPPPIAAAGHGEKALDVGGRQVREPEGRLPGPLARQERRGRSRMLLDRDGGQAPDIPQELAVGHHQRLDPRDRGPCEWPKELPALQKALQAADRRRDAAGAPMKIAPARAEVLGRQGRQAVVPLPAEVSLDGRAPQDVALAGEVPIALRQQPVVKGVEGRPEHRQGNMVGMGLG